MKTFAPAVEPASVGPYTLVEPCCGSGALTLHLLGATRAVLPYQGSKWRFRREIAEVLAAMGFVGPPCRVDLTDTGPWGIALGRVIDKGSRDYIVAQLRVFADQDPLEVYQSLAGHEVSTDPLTFTAEFLFLQRLAFSSKAVGVRDGRWVSPGFCRSSAYGLTATDRFGDVHPMVPSMIATLESYDDHLERYVGGASWRTRCGCPFADTMFAPTVVYLDPPYSGVTSYPNGDLSRVEVLAIAEAWRVAGAAVVVSEAVPLDLPGWKHTCLTEGRRDTSRFRSQHPEWLTWHPAPDDACWRTP